MDKWAMLDDQTLVKIENFSNGMYRVSFEDGDEMEVSGNRLDFYAIERMQNQLSQLNKNDLIEDEDRELPYPAIIFIIGIILCTTGIGALIGIPMIIIAVQELIKKGIFK